MTMTDSGWARSAAIRRGSIQSGLCVCVCWERAYPVCVCVCVCWERVYPLLPNPFISKRYGEGPIQTFLLSVTSNKALQSPSEDSEGLPLSHPTQPPALRKITLADRGLFPEESFQTPPLKATYPPSGDRKHYNLLNSD